ncbi:MAG: hypothetical protein K2Q33_02875 [Gammaproteobacteria bacterium]|nr:hypothetical protein [Gammaproteobacteria bacterium]
MIEPVQHEDGRFLYSIKQLLAIIELLPDKRKCKILKKAIDYMDNTLANKLMAIAISLDCDYDEIAMLWARRSKIRL